MKVCIFKPRLDCTFKKLDGIVPKKIGEVPKIRIPFLQLVESINNGLSSSSPIQSSSASHGVHILPQPGQFSPQCASPLSHALQ